MNKLISLEWKKLKQKSIFGEVVIYLIILMVMPLFFIKMVSADFGKSFDAMFELIQSIQRGLVLFGASLISQVFIDEYKNKTISLSFSYPISRQKLFVAKILFISRFIFLTTIASFLLTGVTTYLLNLAFPIIQFPLTLSHIASYLGGMFTGSLIVILISFIPLFYFAIWRRGTIPTVICAITVMNLPNFSSVFHLDSKLLIAILCILGAFSLFLSVKTAERVGEI
nr:ABC transporter permease [Fredinandcohnia sp. SECRCQ15]